ncbi:Type 1 glutamine amidotransferase-like domain-containing protein [Nocardia sp. JMUB6875]|uniref:Type 1 glutamine amidotransferase-like domain-containing protein n=1 Tax=Nocardia sp. JMUB6875 TaxID=3158170 RepID=UPI0032E605C1
MAGHVVATGAGQRMMGRAADPLHDFILGLTGKPQPRVLFLGTATGDDPGYIVSFYETYNSDRCRPFHLRLFDRSITDLRSFILSMDVVHVGGGNTANMLDVWRRQGVDAILREAWENGAVMTGGSAGAICWFEGGTTDSFGPTLQILPEGLGFVAGSCCPHYDAEDQRQPLFHRAIQKGELPAGYAIDDLVSLHFHGAQLVEAVSSQADGKAYRVAAAGDEVVETPIPVRHLKG